MQSYIDRPSEPEEVCPWRTYLYELQLRAPKPRQIVSANLLAKVPEYYGKSYHGPISHLEAVNLVAGVDGNYLIRDSSSVEGEYVLEIWFDNRSRAFRLHYDGKHYVADKRFDTVYELVWDGLIYFYLEAHAADYIAKMDSETESFYTDTLTSRKRQAAQHSIKGRASSDITDSKIIRESIIPNSIFDYEKRHNFTLHTFMGPTFCDFCGNFLWGLRHQGVKCIDCGFSAHKKCSERAAENCSPELKYVRRLYGVDLTTLVKAHNTVVPCVVSYCIEYIESQGGLEAEGIYRIAGARDQVERIRAIFDQYGEDTQLSSGKPDVHTVASAFKLFFRLLPIPLISFESYDSFIVPIKKANTGASRLNEKEKLHLIKTALALLPPSHYHTLSCLMKHLSRVSSQSSINKMTAANLAIVFAPTLMRSPQLDVTEALQNSAYEQAVISTLITHHDSLFVHKAEKN